MPLLGKYSKFASVRRKAALRQAVSARLLPGSGRDQDIRSVRRRSAQDGERLSTRHYGYDQPLPYGG